MTKEQAIQAGQNIGTEIHYGPCKVVIGPRGGVRLLQTRVRSTGKCKTWTTRPDEFRLPIKHGMYDSSSVRHDNSDAFHLASECQASAAAAEHRASREAQ